jgi:hypothetical protein
VTLGFVVFALGVFIFAHTKKGKNFFEEKWQYKTGQLFGFAPFSAVSGVPQPETALNKEFSRSFTVQKDTGISLSHP